MEQLRETTAIVPQFNLSNPPGLELPLKIRRTHVVHPLHVPWVEPPPIADWTGSKNWVHYILEEHPLTGKQILLRETKDQAANYFYRYYDRRKRVSLNLKRPLLVPAGLLQVEK